MSRIPAATDIGVAWVEAQRAAAKNRLNLRRREITPERIQPGWPAAARV